MQIIAWEPIRLDIPDDRLAELMQMHVEHWDGEVDLNDGVALSDIVLQAIKAGIVDENDIGGEWCDCRFDDELIFPKDCPKPKRKQAKRK